MADELDPIEQRFIAEMTEYIDEIKRGADDARQFADANVHASAAVDGMRTHAFEAGTALGDLRDHAEAAKEADNGLRDSALEAGAAFGSLRDKALEAAVAEREARDSADGMAGRLDTMGTSGTSAAGGLTSMLTPMSALVALAIPMAPAITAAGLGIGAFAAMALPALTSVAKGYQQITADQQAVTNAVTAAARSTALAKLQHDMAGLSAPVASVLQQITSLKNEFTGLAQSSGITSAVFADISKGLGIVRQLLPVIVPLAQQGATAIGHMLSALSGGLKSAGFLDFMRTMTALVVPAADALGRLAGALLGVLGHALTALAPLSVPFINILTAIVRALNGPVVAALRVAATLLVSFGNAITPLLPTLSRLATTLISGLGAAFVKIVPVIGQVAQILVGGLSPILPVIASAIVKVAGAMTASLVKAIVAALPSFVQLVSTAAKFLVSLTPLIPSLVQLDLAFIRMLIAITPLLPSIIKLTDKGLQFLTTVIVPLIPQIIRLINQFTSLATTAAHVLGSITGFIAGAVNWGTMLWNAGVAIVQGLINGIKSMFSSLGSVASSIGSFIASLKGPLPKDLTLLVPHGQAIMQGLMNGIGSQMPALRAQLAGVTGGIPGMVGAGGLAIAGAGAGGTRATVNITAQFGAGTQGLNDPAFLQYIQRIVQEATLRYTGVNPSNGLSLGGKL